MSKCNLSNGKLEFCEAMTQTLHDHEGVHHIFIPESNTEGLLIGEILLNYCPFCGAKIREEA